MDEAESTAPQQAIVLTIRPSSGSTFTTAISTDSTVLQLKEKLATADLPAGSIRLVYSGRVLKDDDQLSVYCKFSASHSLLPHHIYTYIFSQKRVRVCGFLCVMMALVKMLP
jgi:ubiquilin